MASILANLSLSSAVLLLTSYSLNAQITEETLNKGISAQKTSQIDVGFEYTNEDYNSFEVNAFSKHFTYTNFYSPARVHLKFEGNVALADSDSSDVYASVFGAGFAYFFMENWSLTSYLRAGAEHDHKSDTTTRVVGFDTTNEIYINADNDSIISIENKFGFIEYRSNGDGASANGYFYTENYLGFDILASKSGLFGSKEQTRIKMTGGIERKLGGDDTVMTIYDAIVSLRTVDEITGIDKVKFELRGSVGDGEYSRVIAGITVTY